MAALFAFPRADEIDWTDSRALGWYLYDFNSAMIIAVLEWKAGGCQRGRHGNAFPRTVHLKAVQRYVEEY